jgi:ribosomal protein L37AE/L43A
MIKFYVGYTFETLVADKVGLIRGVSGRQDHVVQWQCPDCGSGKVRPIYPKSRTRGYRIASPTDPKRLPSYDKTVIWECSACGHNETGEHFVKREIRLPAYTLRYFNKFVAVLLIFILIIFALIKAVYHIFS